MESILHTFGIDWRLLLVSGVNFCLLLVGLTYFLYKPVLNMLEERRRKVVEGVDAAERAQLALAQTEMLAEKRLTEAAKEAEAMVREARAAGSTQGAQLVEQSKERAERVVEEARVQARALKEEAVRESKKEVAKLVVLGVEQMLKTK